MKERLVVPGTEGRIVHAHLTIGNGGVMLSSAEDYAFPTMCKTPKEVGGVGTVEIIVYVDGGRSFSCKDPEGHVWAFGSYNPWASGA